MTPLTEHDLRAIIVGWLGGRYSNRYFCNPDYVDAAEVELLVAVLMKRMNPQQEG